MEAGFWIYLFWAVAIGAISSASLPLGSVAGLVARFRPLTLALLAAFGAGALIAALAIELVAPTVYALEHGGRVPGRGDAHTDFAALIVGAALGGVLFVSLDQVVNAHGGFLRKTASIMAHFRTRRRTRVEQLLERAADVPFLRKVPPHDVQRLVNVVRPCTFTNGEPLFEKGDPVEALLYVRTGSVRIEDDRHQLTELGEHSLIGVIPLLTGAAHPATAIAIGTVECLRIPKRDFDELRKTSPEFDEACREVASEHLEILKDFHSRRTEEAVRWADDALHSLRIGSEPPSVIELLAARKRHPGAPLAIWLGILLDGIPESLVIGFGFLTLLGDELSATGGVTFTEVIPYTLVAGLFLSNFPEALSSSASMRDLGWRSASIFQLWFSLVVVTALGAGIGFVVGDFLPHAWLVLAEGLAAGAMLTMIASTMIPEAVHSGNPPAVGLGTLAGFLAAILFKLLE